MVTDSPQAGKPHGHSSVPPCTCPQCLRDTAQADQRLAKIAEILLRLDEIEQSGKEALSDD